MSYEIKDPWQVRVREYAVYVFVCAWRGHCRVTSFNGAPKPCQRCSR